MGNQHGNGNEATRCGGGETTRERQGNEMQRETKDDGQEGSENEGETTGDGMEKNKSMLVVQRATRNPRLPFEF